MFKVLKLGNSLVNSELWKLMQVLFNLFAIWIPIVNILIPTSTTWLTPEFISALTVAIGSTNAYLTLATSEK